MFLLRLVGTVVRALFAQRANLVAENLGLLFLKTLHRVQCIMTQPTLRKRNLRHLWATLLLFLVLLVVTNCSHPRDERIETNFAKDFDTFQTLRTMITDDSTLVCVDRKYYNTTHSRTTSYSVAGQGISELRWDNYRSLLRRLGRSARVCRMVDGDVYFYLSEIGFVFQDSSKGVAYRDPEPSPIYPSLDRSRDELPTRFGYKRMKDNWYIFLTFD